MSGLFRCMVIADVGEELRARVPAAVDTGRYREAILLLHDEGLGLRIPERNYKIKQRLGDKRYVVCRIKTNELFRRKK